MESELNEIITRVKALDIGGMNQPNVRAHLKWEAGQMVTRLNPDDLTDIELAALIAVLHAAHARVLGGPSSTRPTLTLIPSESAPQFCESVG
jgi:hypothetical protein